MMKPPLRCPKCSAEMKEGFLADRGHANSHHCLLWMHGKPERSFWGGVKTRGKERAEVQTFRCSKCGYLESYAT